MRIIFFYLFLAWEISLFAYKTEEPTSICQYTKNLEVKSCSSGMPYVDCIYLINLDQRADRLRRIYKEFSPYNLCINRVSAVNGWTLPEEVLKELGGPYGIPMGRGHFGCLLSHLSVLLDAYARDFNVIWVLEDDAVIIKNISVLPGILAELEEKDPKWDLLFTDLDYRNPKGGYIQALATNARPDQPIASLSHYTRKKAISENLLRIHNRYATHSMIISKRGIKKMVEYFTHVYIWQPIDIDMHYIPGFREYTTSKDIVSNSLRIDSNISQPLK